MIYFSQAWSTAVFKKKHAIIGAGPSGLAAAYFLARAGFNVTVFEKQKQAGGLVQNVIPQFRLPQEAIDKDVEFIKNLGVKFEFGVKEEFSISDIKGKFFTSSVYIKVKRLCNSRVVSFTLFNLWRIF